MTFLHTPTGRKILYSYDGTNWLPIISSGTMTVYVDKTDGTDDTSHGTGVDASAFKTIQYAVNCIPGLVGGSVVININAESYGENVVIKGKQPTGNYPITLQGILSKHDDIVSDGNGDKGATTTQPSFYENGMTSNHYQNQLIKFTSGANNGLYRCIDSNSNDAGTRKIVLCGETLVAQPVANDTATVYDWGTIITSITFGDYQSSIIVNDIYFNSGAATSITMGNECAATYTRVKTNGTGYGVSVQFNSVAMFYYSVLLNTNTGCGTYNGISYFYGCLFRGFTTYGVYSENMASIYLRYGCVIDGGTAAAQTGCYIAYRTLSVMWNPDVYNKIRNCQYGVRAIIGGVATLTGYNSYSGNTNNENSDGLAGSYID
jgi:hypothetical protein